VPVDPVNPARLRTLLEQVRDGATDVEQAIDSLRRLPFEDLTYAVVDHHRSLRCDVPEVIYCASKTPEQTVGIARSLAAGGEPVLATRVDEATERALRAAFPGAVYNAIARTVLLPVVGMPTPGGLVAVLSAGTSDLPVAEETAVTSEAMGCEVRRVYDIGVAGLHRLLRAEDLLRSADCTVVVAGMEGALASVVGGIVSCPLIAVPTSVGYGASFGGLAALLAMLNSCAAGVTVVNIDNGFGAGVAASRIARRAAGVGATRRCDDAGAPASADGA
jgi:NCAIR mutase (PurE)-related protein